LAEQLTLNQLVTGSSPVRLTTFPFYSKENRVAPVGSLPLRGDLVTSWSQSPEEGGIEASDCIALHVGCDMRVGVGGDLDAAVPESFADNLQVDSALE
jgi:hypothetical protein